MQASISTRSQTKAVSQPITGSKCSSTAPEIVLCDVLHASNVPNSVMAPLIFGTRVSTSLKVVHVSSYAWKYCPCPRSFATPCPIIASRSFVDPVHKADVANLRDCDTPAMFLIASQSTYIQARTSRFAIDQSFFAHLPFLEIACPKDHHPCRALTPSWPCLLNLWPSCPRTVWQLHRPWSCLRQLSELDAWTLLIISLYECIRSLVNDFWGYVSYSMIPFVYHARRVSWKAHRSKFRASVLRHPHDPRLSIPLLRPWAHVKCLSANALQRGVHIADWSLTSIK